jgi:hypothetical protein
MNLFCNKEFISKTEELKLKKRYSDENLSSTFKYAENPDLNLIGIINSYSDYLLINTGNAIPDKWFISKYIVDENNKIKYHYTNKTINDISFTKQFETSASDAEDCFIGYDYLSNMSDSMEKQQDKFKDNQHFITLYEELSEIQNKEDENPVLIELKVE